MRVQHAAATYVPARPPSARPTAAPEGAAPTAPRATEGDVRQSTATHLGRAAVSLGLTALTTVNAVIAAPPAAQARPAMPPAPHPPTERVVPLPQAEAPSVSDASENAPNAAQGGFLFAPDRIPTLLPEGLRDIRVDVLPFRDLPTDTGAMHFESSGVEWHFGLVDAGVRAVQTARGFIGQRSASLFGRLPFFRAAGGATNNCADFVSSVLRGAGLLRGHYTYVPTLEQGLRQEGYVRVPRHQSRPGDVWISSSRSHTEIVAEPGGRLLIGSNNNGRWFQTITQHAPWNAGVYYQRAIGR